MPDRWKVSSVTGADVATAPAAGDSTDGGSSDQLRPGELQQVVTRLLGGCVEPVTPTWLAKAAGGRSAGAVGNCLERLVTAGVAVRVSDHPKAYLPRLTSR
jgi:hypothetical protein